jgi:hypothetical protein
MRASVFLLGCVYPRGILRGKRGLTWRCAPAIARFAIASTRLPLTRGCVRRTIAATWSGVSELMVWCRLRRWFVVIVSFLSESRITYTLSKIFCVLRPSLSRRVSVNARYAGLASSVRAPNGTALRGCAATTMKHDQAAKVTVGEVHYVSRRRCSTRSFSQ